MNTRKIIDEMCKRIFNSDFQQAIKEEYESHIADASLKTLEADYSVAIPYLENNLTDGQRNKLLLIEDLFKANISYADEYSFFCGMVYALEQSFAPTRRTKHTHNNSILGGLLSMPEMKQHPAFYERSELINDETEKLVASLDEDAKEHFISVVCAWDQRVYSSTFFSYYTGYQAGINIIDAVNPHLARVMTANVHHLERELELTEFNDHRE